MVSGGHISKCTNKCYHLFKSQRDIRKKYFEGFKAKSCVTVNKKDLVFWGYFWGAMLMFKSNAKTTSLTENFLIFMAAYKNT